jgi:hypothetical protein
MDRIMAEPLMQRTQRWLRLCPEQRTTVEFALRHCGPVPAAADWPPLFALADVIAALRELNRVSHGHGREALDIVEKLIRTVSKDDLKAFCTTCVLLRSLWRHYEIWLEGSELLQSIAPIFFRDIHAMFVRTLILEICKITDPPKTMGRTNITIKFLIEYSDFSSAQNTLDKLKRCSDSMHAFRKKIVPARNRLIAHFDRESVQLGKPLGGAPQEDWLQFWHDLQEFLYIMHKHYVDPNSHFYLNASAQSDAEVLVEALK